MYLLRKYLGEESSDYIIEYLYRNYGRPKFIADLIRKKLSGEKAYYIAHEPGSAFVLSLIGQRYSLVYHQQGPMVQEYINLMGHPHKWKLWKKKIIERRAFLHAEKVHFPSRGAEEVYFNSHYATVKRNQVSIGSVLYNTINLDEEVLPLEQICAEEDSLTFLSVGTMTELKGQDLSLEFIKLILQRVKEKVRWITVGDGPIKKKVTNECEQLMDENSNFTYVHFDKLPHGSVIYLDAISDVYLMLHRTAIFDLSTLEAMDQQCALVLSNIGGNKDYDVNHNCILVDVGQISEGVDRFLQWNIFEKKCLNKQVFDQCFSPVCFREHYIKLIEDISEKR